jgi:hypothetical protein
MNCPDASEPIWTASKERVFRGKVAAAKEARAGDPEVKVSVILARLGKLLALLDLVPPHSATEGAFRLVRSHCIDFHGDMEWLREHASEAGDAIGEPMPSEARVGTQFPSSLRCFESPRPSGRVPGGPEGIFILKTSGEIEPRTRKSDAAKNSALTPRTGVPDVGCLVTVDSKTPPFLGLRFHMTYIVQSYRYEVGLEGFAGL